MLRLVSYRIIDRNDGRFDAIATMKPDRVYRREGFVSLAQAEEWVEGLRTLMAALGAPLAREDQFAPAQQGKARTAMKGQATEASEADYNES